MIQMYVYKYKVMQAFYHQQYPIKLGPNAVPKYNPNDKMWVIKLRRVI